MDSYVKGKVFDCRSLCCLILLQAPGIPLSRFYLQLSSHKLRKPFLIWPLSSFHSLSTAFPQLAHFTLPISLHLAHPPLILRPLLQHLSSRARLSLTHSLVLRAAFFHTSEIDRGPWNAFY